MDEVIKWALDIIGKLPPVPLPTLIAFLIVALLVSPLIRKALRGSPERVVPEVVQHVSVDPGWLYTTLINLDLKIQGLDQKITLIDRMLRRRSGRSKKLKSPDPADPS